MRVFPLGLYNFISIVHGYYMKKNCNESCSPLTAEFYDCCDMYHMKFIIMRVIVLYTWTSITSNCCDKYVLY